MKLSSPRLMRVELVCVEVLGLLLLALCAWRIGFGAPTSAALQFQPVPDAAEQVYTAWAFANGHSTLIPTAHELHPGRYSPVHPFMMSVWMRLLGGDLNSCFSYSSAALLVGLALMWGVLVRLGWPVVARVIGIILIFVSTLFFKASQVPMQEGSMWLLFTIGLLGFQMGMTTARDWLRWSGLVVAGMSCGALLAIRPSMLPLLPLMMLQGWIVAPRGWRWGMVGGLIGSAGLVVLLVLAWQWHWVHRLALTNYTYWSPPFAQGAIDWKYGWLKAGEDVAGRTVMVRYLRAFGGFSGEITTMSPVIVLFFAGGALAGAGVIVVRAIRQRAVALLGEGLILFWLLLAVAEFGIHLIYTFYAPRFSIIGWPALMLAGVGGWIVVFRGLCGRLSWAGRWLYPVLLGFMVVIVIVGRAGWWGELKNNIAENPRAQAANAKMLWAAGVAGKMLKNFKGPIAVGGMPALNARLMLDLPGLEYPIFPLLSDPRPDWDPQLDPGYVGEFPVARGVLANWDLRPPDSGLWLRTVKKINTPVEAGILAGGKRFAAFLPGWFKTKQLGAQEGLRAAGWKIRVIEVPPAGYVWFAEHL